MNNTNLLKIAAVLAVACGLLELYEALSFVEDIKRGAQNAARAVCIIIVPFIIIAGAAGLYLGRIVIGAGTIVNGLAIQHTMIDLAPRHFLAFLLGLASIAIALYVQRQFDEIEEREKAVAAPQAG